MGLFTRRLAIDLGTAYSLVADADQKTSPVRVASAIAFDQSTNKVAAYGDEAKKMWGRCPDSYRVVRPMQDGVIADYKAAKSYLSYLVQSSKKPLWALYDELFVCVPWGATASELRGYLDGLKRTRSKVNLVREPFAAALGCGADVLGSKPITIIDMGGGTTEMVTIESGFVLLATSLRAAGNFCDQLIYENVLKQKGFEIGWQASEDLKAMHGTVWPQDWEYSFEFMGNKRQSHCPDTGSLHTSEVRSFLEPYALKVEWNIKEHLQQLPVQARQQVEREGVLLVGGTSQLKGWEERLSSRLGIHCQKAKIPTHAVIHGLQEIIRNPKKYKPILRISEKVYSS